MMDPDLTPEQRAELGDLKPLYNRLAQYNVPEPDNMQLLTSLKPLLSARRAASAELPLKRKSIGEWLRLAWMQTELLGIPFWWSSVLLTLLGLLIGVGDSSGVATIYLILASPLLAVGAVGYIFRPATRTLWELERLSHIHPLELLYARLALILLLNALWVLLLLLLIWIHGAQVILWRLLIIWFGPMVGLTGIALFCTVRWNTGIGITTPLLTWGIMIGLGWRDVVLNMPFTLVTANGLLGHIGTSNNLLLMAFTALISGVMLLYKSGKWMVKWP